MNARANGRGFTLIELLVVVVIIAIVMSIAVLSLNLVGNDREMRTEARRFMSLLELAQDEAMLQGREFGLEFMTGGYRFVEYDAYTNQWSEFIDDELRLRTLPESIELSLFLEDKKVLLDADPAEIASVEDDRRAEQFAPHLLIYSSGDMTPFELAIGRQFDDLTVSMKGDILGNLEFVSDEE